MFKSHTLKELRQWAVDCPGWLNAPVFPNWKRTFELAKAINEAPDNIAALKALASAKIDVG